jgi:hypothetical protein
LYTINPNQHSPLIGLHDGFPICGAVVTLIPMVQADFQGVRKSGYQLSSNTTRTNGPAIEILPTLTVYFKRIMFMLQTQLTNFGIFITDDFLYYQNIRMEYIVILPHCRFQL